MTDTLLPDRPMPTPSAPAPDRGAPWRVVILAGLVVLAGVKGGWPLLVMIGALVAMITLHELGHFLTAKWAGMKVTEFFIGFGPRIWSVQRGETEYGVKALPLGAYVKIIGMHNLDEFDEADADRTYMSKPFWRRLSVAVAGSTMHFLLAFACLFVAFAFVGLDGGRAIINQSDFDALQADQSEAPWLVDSVAPDSAAEVLGLAEGDRIISVDGVATDGFGAFGEVVRDLPGETVSVVYEHDGEQRSGDVEIGRREDDPDVGFFGVGPDEQVVTETVGILDAVGSSASAFGRAVGETFHGLGTILSPSGITNLADRAFTTDDGPAVVGASSSGGSSSSSSEPTPVGIIGITDGGADLLSFGAWGAFLTIFAIVNIFIGIFNLVPLLPLDGGHVVIAVYEKIRSVVAGRDYHVDVVKLLPVTYAVVLVLAFLGISTIVLDTRNLVGG